VLIVRTCFLILLKAALRDLGYTLTTMILNLISGETPVKSTHACLPSTHSYTRTSLNICVNLPSCGLVKMLTYTFFFIDALVCLNILKMISPTKSCMYLKLWSSLLTMKIIVLRTNYFYFSLKEKLIIYKTRYSHFKICTKAK